MALQLSIQTKLTPELLSSLPGWLRRAPQETKAELLTLLLEKQKRQARIDINSFIEFVLKDEAGQSVRQAAIHRSWHEHIAYCKRTGRRPIIMAPWGHGKTQQLVVGLTLFELGQNRNQRIGIVCNSDANARKRVTAIKTYIERDLDYRSVFPHVRPDKSQGWGKEEFFVQRDESARSVDPSVWSAGIFSTGIGGRVDGLIIDDPVDLRNAILMPALRPAVIETVKNVWMSRLEPQGWLVYVATAWHPADCTHHLIRDVELRAQYCALIQRVSDDYSAIECYRSGGGGDAL